MNLWMGLVTFSTLLECPILWQKRQKMSRGSMVAWWSVMWKHFEGTWFRILFNSYAYASVTLIDKIASITWGGSAIWGRLSQRNRARRNVSSTDASLSHSQTSQEPARCHFFGGLYRAPPERALARLADRLAPPKINRQVGRGGGRGPDDTGCRRSLLSSRRALTELSWAEKRRRAPPLLLVPQIFLRPKDSWPANRTSYIHRWHRTNMFRNLNRCTFQFGQINL